VFDFDSALWLGLLPVVWFLIWRWGRSLDSLYPGRLAWLMAARLCTASLLVVALAGPGCRMSREHLGVVFISAIDPGVTDAEKARAEAWLELALAARSAEGESAVLPVAHGAALADALLAAQAMLPSVDRAVLISDGSGWSELAWQEARSQIIASGLETDILALTPPAAPAVGFRQVILPPALAPGEPFRAEVELMSNVSGTARLRVFLDGLLEEELPFELEEGTQIVPTSLLRTTRKITPLELELIPPEGVELPPPPWKTYVVTDAEPALLLVDPEPESLRPLQRVLQEAGFVCELISPAALPSSGADLQGYVGIVLSDTPAPALNVAQVRAVESWVRETGGGLFVLGGPSAFSSGEYFGTELEKMLPVESRAPEKETKGTMAMLVVLDRSGSMSASVGNQTKMALANQGAAMVLDLLSGQDYFGVLAVDTSVNEVLPLRRIRDKAAETRQVLGTTAAGGGIYVYTAMAEAFRLLRGNQAAVKHVILFADASDAEEQFAGSPMPGGGQGRSALDLTSSMLASRITTSVVALGRRTDKDLVFLQALASRGGGRFYLTDDAATLPRLFALETMRMKRDALVEQPGFAQPVVPVSGPVRAIPWDQAPPLLGHQLTTAKPGSRNYLLTAEGDPLLTVWNWGSGRVVTFTSDLKARWAAEWINWPGYGQLASQLIRSGITPARDRAPEWEFQEESDGSLQLNMRFTRPDGQAWNGLQLELVETSETDSTALKIEQTGPGTYQAKWASRPAEAKVFLLRDLDDPAFSFPLVLGPGAQTEPVLPGAVTERMEKLTQLKDGRLNPGADEVWRAGRGEVLVTRRPLSGLLLALAAILFVCDVGLRRWPVRRKDGLASE